MLRSIFRLRAAEDKAGYHPAPEPPCRAQQLELVSQLISDRCNDDLCVRRTICGTHLICLIAQGRRRESSIGITIYMLRQVLD